MDLGAFVALPPAAAYILGLIAFWMQLSVAYTFSESWTTWYAATLAPKLLVIGIGITVIAQAISLSALITVFLLFFAKYRTKQEERPDPKAEPMPAFLYKALPIIVAALALDLLSVSFIGDSFNTDFGLQFLLVPIVMLYLLFVYIQFRHDLGLGTLKKALSYYPRWSLEVPVIIFLLLMVLFTFYPTNISTPCLTSQRYVGPAIIEDNTITVKSEGRLVAHTNGYWYVFDESNNLVAIPDNNANSMKISGALYEPQLPSILTLPVQLVGNGLAWLFPGLAGSPEQDTPSKAKVENNPSAPASEACF